MKVHIERGKNFYGLARYLLRKKKSQENRPGASLIGGNMLGQTPVELATEFAEAQVREDIKNPVWHTSLSLPEKEHLTDDKWQEVVEAFLKKLDIDTTLHQYFLVKHKDTDHEHVHICLSRISLENNVWHGRNDVKKAINATQQLEKEFNLTVTKGLYDKADKTRPTYRETRKSKRTGEPIPKIELQEKLDKILEQNPTTASEFVELLKQNNIKFRANVASTGKMNGFSFVYKDKFFKASSLGKKYTWYSIKKDHEKFYDIERDIRNLIDDEEKIKAIFAHYEAQQRIRAKNNEFYENQKLLREEFRVRAKEVTKDFFHNQREERTVFYEEKKWQESDLSFVAMQSLLAHKQACEKLNFFDNNKAKYASLKAAQQAAKSIQKVEFRQQIFQPLTA